MEKIIHLKELGYHDGLAQQMADLYPGFVPGRVMAEHKERYIVRTAEGEVEAEITGNLRFTARNREDYPAVGDWVALMIYDGGTALIHGILPRRSVISRQAVGQPGGIQLIAANVDTAFLVQAVDRDLSLNRLERYLTLCYDGGVAPVILLSKVDLIDPEQLSVILEDIRSRIANVPVVAVSNASGEGYGPIRAMIERGKSYCLLGSSGVGKSTLLNNLCGREVMRTAAISQSIDRGRHVTTHRELILLDGGGILIDNPGMREVGTAAAANGLELTFDELTDLSRRCRFPDCTHTVEAGCAILAAVEQGAIDRAAYDNYLKMAREKAHYEATVEERRQKERQFGKMMKNYHKTIKKNR